MGRPRRTSPEQILAAAALEFAKRGYAGARVDRIARRARVNKAMLYYHFGSKKALYRSLLRRVFTQAALRLQDIGARDCPPSDQLDLAIGALAAFIEEHAFFPAIMLREMAEGGAHLDRETLAALASVPRALDAIIERGVARKAFRPVHPLAAYITMMAPIVVYLAGAPIRREIAAQRLLNPAPLAGDQFVRHVQDSMRRVLAPDAPKRKAHEAAR